MNARIIFGCLDQYAKLNLPINFSEVSILSRRDLGDGDRFQELAVERLYRLWFSHPATEAIVWWNLVDGTAAYAPLGSEEGENRLRAGLVGYDFAPKPAFRTLERLIRTEWRTETGFDYADGGDNRFHGFYGDYAVEVRYDGGSFTRRITLSKDGVREFTLSPTDGKTTGRPEPSERGFAIGADFVKPAGKGSGSSEVESRSPGGWSAHVGLRENRVVYDDCEPIPFPGETDRTPLAAGQCGFVTECGDIVPLMLFPGCHHADRDVAGLAFTDDIQVQCDAFSVLVGPEQEELPAPLPGFLHGGVNLRRIEVISDIHQERSLCVRQIAGQGKSQRAGTGIPKPEHFPAVFFGKFHIARQVRSKDRAAHFRQSGLIGRNVAKDEFVFSWNFPRSERKKTGQCRKQHDVEELHVSLSLPLFIVIRCCTEYLEYALFRQVGRTSPFCFVRR